MTDSMNQDAVTESGSDLQSDVSDMQWFVVQAFSGFEKHVQESLREYIRRAAMEDHFADIEVPTEQVVELRNGQKRTSERKFFPGYVLVRMRMSDEAWHLVKSVPKVSGFRGRNRF